MTIERKHTNNRMSQIVVHGETVYLAGQVGEAGASVADQTRQALHAVERLLTEAGSDKYHLLQATIWLADMADFNEMNTVWDAWIGEGNAPTRACGEARLANADWKVEVIVVAARR